MKAHELANHLLDMEDHTLAVSWQDYWIGTHVEIERAIDEQGRRFVVLNAGSEKREGGTR